MIIGILCWINGVISVLRFCKFEDAFKSDEEVVLYTISFFIESLTFFCALWLFGLRFYETVLDLETMVLDDDSRD